MFTSITESLVESSATPRHVVIIMDGNGRWAKKRFLPRVMGHKRGLEMVRKAVKYCSDYGIEYLTLFAFSTENWRRSPAEVSFLMSLFLQALQKEVLSLYKNNLRLRVVGSRARFSAEIVECIEKAEAMTAANTGLTLTIAADYGGRWDMLQATNSLIKEGVTEITEAALSERLCMHFAPEPDLFIRTGGEVRISNFLLWQLAYAELYFTEVLWPDFDEQALEVAILSYQNRERRFGRASEQLPLDKQRS